MAVPKTPLADPARLAAVARYEAVAGDAAPALADVARLAAQVTGSEVAAAAFVRADTVVIAAATTTAGEALPAWCQAEGTPCADVVRTRAPLVVRDAAADPRYLAWPLLALGLRGYAGAPLLSPDGVAVGALAVFGRAPRELRPADVGALEALARQLVTQLELRHGVRELARSVEERRRAEAALRQSNGALLAILDSAPLGIVTLDRESTVLSWNASLERMFGWTAAEAVGRRLPYIPAGKEEEHRGFRDRVFEGGRIVQTELVRERKDGSKIDVRLTAAPLHGAPGEVVGIMGILEDITERKRAEEARRRTEESFRAVIERSPDAIFVHRAGRLVYVNPTTLTFLGYDRAEELVGGAVLDLVPADERPLVRERIRGIEASGVASPPREFGFLRRDGSTARAEVVGVGITFDGEPAVLAIARDITERVRLQARLLLADRMASVGTLAAGVAHEINNPLTYIIANSRWALAHLDEPASPSRAAGLRDALESSLEGAERVYRIVQDLTAFSRADDESLGPVDVVPHLESAIKLAWNEIRHRARLVRELEVVPPVLATASRLGQVFLNLLVNAAQAVPEGAAARNEIRLRANSAEGRVVVEVQDTGVGIAPEHLGRIFEPFFTTKEVGAGTGLGLFICHNIVEQLGGEITVESRLGVGTTFRVSLPAAAADAPVAPGGRAAPAAAPRRGRILVIDDEPHIGTAVRRVLEGDHEVTVLTGAREALDRIAAGHRWDVILCDLMMPDMGGVELWTELDKTAPWARDRLVLITGGAFTARARAFLEEHPIPCLEKPFGEAALRKVLDERLG